MPHGTLRHGLLKAHTGSAVGLAWSEGLKPPSTPAQGGASDYACPAWAACHRPQLPTLSEVHYGSEVLQGLLP